MTGILTPLTTERALALFDSLDAVGVEEMIGTWAGEEVATGHPMDGLLAATGWYGKRFVDAETVHPLLFHTADRRAVFPVDPARLPMTLPVPRSPLLRHVVTLGRPLLGTRRPAARLRATAYRGVVSATMVYDARPINDVFRRLDEDTVLGGMDLRGAPPYFFTLRRDDTATVLV